MHSQRLLFLLHFAYRANQKGSKPRPAGQKHNPAAGPTLSSVPVVFAGPPRWSCGIPLCRSATAAMSARHKSEGRRHRGRPASTDPLLMSRGGGLVGQAERLKVLKPVLRTAKQERATDSDRLERPWRLAQPPQSLGSQPPQTVSVKALGVGSRPASPGTLGHAMLPTCVKSATHLGYRPAPSTLDDGDLAASQRRRRRGHGATSNGHARSKRGTKRAGKPAAARAAWESRASSGSSLTSNMEARPGTAPTATTQPTPAPAAGVAGGPATAGPSSSARPSSSSARARQQARRELSRTDGAAATGGDGAAGTASSDRPVSSPPHSRRVPPRTTRNNLPKLARGAGTRGASRPVSPLLGVTSLTAESFSDGSGPQAAAMLSRLPVNVLDAYFGREYLAEAEAALAAAGHRVQRVRQKAGVASSSSSRAGKRRGRRAKKDGGKGEPSAWEAALEDNQDPELLMELLHDYYASAG